MIFPSCPGSVYVAQYRLMQDNGRAVATGTPDDQHMWRVPSLRNLVYTAPYFHNESVKALAEAVRVMVSSQLDKNLAEPHVADIVAFLEALTGKFPVQTMPRLPPTSGDMLE
jgi:cytochrome c peroxidase